MDERLERIFGAIEGIDWTRRWTAAVVFAVGVRFPIGQFSSSALFARSVFFSQIFYYFPFLFFFLRLNCFAYLFGLMCFAFCPPLPFGCAPLLLEFAFFLIAHLRDHHRVCCVYYGSLYIVILQKYYFLSML